MDTHVECEDRVRILWSRICNTMENFSMRSAAVLLCCWINELSHFVRERGPPVHFFASTRLLFQLEAVFIISVLIFTFQLTIMFHNICFDFYFSIVKTVFMISVFNFTFFSIDQQFSYNVFSLSIQLMNMSWYQFHFHFCN